jgi:hypothetical protein
LFASGGLQRDFDLAVAAFACKGAGELREIMLHEDGTSDDLKFLYDVREKAQKKLNAHYLCTEEFLYGMSDHSGRDSPLRIIVQDAETTLAFKRIIAEFIGYLRARSWVDSVER